MQKSNTPTEPQVAVIAANNLKPGIAFEKIKKETPARKAITAWTHLPNLTDVFHIEKTKALFHRDHPISILLRKQERQIEMQS